MQTITLIQFPGGQWYPCDEENDRVFSRVVGGFVWAGNKPGVICAVGEEKTLRPPHHAYLLAEDYEIDNFKLISRAVEMFVDCQVQNFYTRMDQNKTEILSSYNQKAKDRHEKPFRVLTAPFTKDNGSIEYHVNILRRRLASTNKTLHLTDFTIRNELTAMPQNEVIRAKDTDYPAVAALGYAVSVLDVFQPDSDYRKNLRILDKRRNEYNPLSRL